MNQVQDLHNNYIEERQLDRDDNESYDDLNIASI